MLLRSELRPPFSLLVIMDIDLGEIPEPEAIRGRRLCSTPSCIVIGTLMAQDGPTSVMLTDEPQADPAAQGMSCAFRGTVETPRKRLGVCTTELKEVLTLFVPSLMARVEIWVNRADEPDRIEILVSDPPDSGQGKAGRP